MLALTTPNDRIHGLASRDRQHWLPEARYTYHCYQGFPKEDNPKKVLVIRMDQFNQKIEIFDEAERALK